MITGALLSSLDLQDVCCVPYSFQGEVVGFPWCLFSEAEIT